MPNRTPETAKTILIVDPDLGFIVSLGQTLMESGYQVLPATSIQEAASLLEELKVEIEAMMIGVGLLRENGFDMSEIFPDGKDKTTSAS